MTTGLGVIVIGAGAAGLAATNYLLAEGHNVLVVERRSRPGGVWNAESGEIGDSKWSDPVYDNLQSNVPRALMTYSDSTWDEKTSLFPPHADVKKYLHRYARHALVSHKRKATYAYNTAVCSVRKCQRDGEKCWEIVIRDTDRTSSTGYREYPIHAEAVVVATGNYDKPHWPDEEPGRRQWEALYPGSVIHANEYKNVRPYFGKNVVIIGNGPSAKDISLQLKGIAKSVTMALRRDQVVSDGVTLIVGEIQSYNPIFKSMVFKCGTVVKDVDCIVYCTGYEYNFPFIVKNKAGDEIFPPGKKVDKLYKHIFYIPDTSLAFVGLTKMSAAFTIAEAQSALIARVWSERLDLPSAQDMRFSSKQLSKECEENVTSCEQYHTLAPSLDKEYINHLASLTLSARPLKNGTQGKPPPYWCNCMDSARDQSWALKQAHKALGDVRHAVNKFEMLGFKLDAPCKWTHKAQIPAGCVACYIP